MASPRGSPPSAARYARRRKARVYIDAGREAVASGSLNAQIEADMRFHAFINELSGNPLIGETTAPHWPYLRRVMGEVLRDDEQMPEVILEEHVAILDAVIAGRGAQAEALSREHILRAANIFVARLQAQQASEKEHSRTRRIQR